MQNDANLVELEKCCQTHILLQNFILIQPRTSPPKICKIFEKCIFENCIFEICISGRGDLLLAQLVGFELPADLPRALELLSAELIPSAVRWEPGVVFRQNFGKMLLVFGCIGTDFCKKKYTSASRKRVTRGRAGHKGVLRPRDKRKRSEGRSSRWFPEKAEVILCRRRPVHYCDRRVERGIS